MDEIKRQRNLELLDKAISYLKELKENDNAQGGLDVRIVVDEGSDHQDFELFVSLDIEEAIGNSKL